MGWIRCCEKMLAKDLCARDAGFVPEFGERIKRDGTKEGMDWIEYDMEMLFSH